MYLKISCEKMPNSKVYLVVKQQDELPNIQEKVFLLTTAKIFSFGRDIRIFKRATLKM